LLSQWRGYGKDGGFAIIFDTSKLERMLEDEYSKYSYVFSLMRPVNYFSENKKNLAEMLGDNYEGFLEAAISVFRGRGLGDATVDIQSVSHGQNMEKSMKVIIQSMSLIKH